MHVVAGVVERAMRTDARKHTSREIRVTEVTQDHR